jgi:ribosomal protein S18 acetylase RimI-like enzyme
MAGRSPPAIRPAEPGDAEALDAALAALSADLGDVHRSDAAALRAHGFGPGASFRALVAEGGGAAGFAGAVLMSPIFSTVKGGPGVYVSDLWVAPGLRGSGLGRRLLAAAAEAARAEWGARHLKLTVYDDNPRARAFYERLGFVADPRALTLAIEGAALDALSQGETP